MGAPILTALDSNGAVATSCGYISTCLASINVIEADVSTATGGTSALATSAELSAAKTALDMATSAMCNQRASLSSSASSASSGLSGAKGVLTGINTMFGFITDALDAIVAGLDDVVRETIYGNRMANEFLPMVLGGISLLISMPILLYLGGSFLGSCCLVLCAKPRNPATQEERKCCHKCGSCFTCFSWFGFSAGVIITLLGSFGALAMATVVTDFGSLFLYIPRSPQTALGPVCDALSFNISDSGRRIDGCGIVSGCFATPSTDLFTAVEQPLGLSDFVNITRHGHQRLRHAARECVVHRRHDRRCPERLRAGIPLRRHLWHSHKQRSLQPGQHAYHHSEDGLHPDRAAALFSTHSDHQSSREHHHHPHCR